MIRHRLLTIAAGNRTPFSVTSGTRVSRDTWWQLAESDETTTFFGTPEWTDILVDAFGRFRPRPYLFQFGGGIRTLVPAIQVQRGFGRLNALHSMPFGTYGGFLGSTAPLADTSRLAMLAHLSADGWGRFQTTVFPNPLGRPLPSDGICGMDSVHAPDLSRGYDAWWQSLDSRTRYHIRKAERRGVEVRHDSTDADLSDFAELYLASARVWRTRTTMGPTFFAALKAHRSERIELWSAHTPTGTGSTQFAAGVLAFRFNRQVTPFLSVVRPECRAWSPTNLIYQRMIERSASGRPDVFSFLGSGNKPNIQRFKQSMGGELKSFGYLNLPGPAYRWLRNPISTRRRVRQDGQPSPAITGVTLGGGSPVSTDTSATTSTLRP